MQLCRQDIRSQLSRKIIMLCIIIDVVVNVEHILGYQEKPCYYLGCGILHTDKKAKYVLDLDYQKDSIIY